MVRAHGTRGDTDAIVQKLNRDLRTVSASQSQEKLGKFATYVDPMSVPETVSSSNRAEAVAADCEEMMVAQ